MNLLEKRNQSIDEIYNAKAMSMCNQDILKKLLEAAVFAHMLDMSNRAKINGLDISHQEHREDGPLTQNLVDGLMRGDVQSKLQIVKLETRCAELDVERRCYITEIESLEAKCQRLEGALQTSRDLCDEIKKSEARTLSDFNRLEAVAGKLPSLES